MVLRWGDGMERDAQRVCLLVLLLLAVFVARPGSAETNEPFLFLETGSGLSFHKEMYMLPVTYSEAYNGRQTEVVFQISAKHGIFSSRFYFGYSQICFWQAYDFKNSAPFRETNYNPEIFYRFPVRGFQGGDLSADMGFEHESNGQKMPFSRSWNLLYVMPHLHRDNLLVRVKLRYRIPEDEKESPLDPVGDDNPDITDYLGFSDIHVSYLLREKHFFHLTLRGLIGCGRGGVSLNYSYPVSDNEASYFVLRLWHGYGENLADYRRNLTRIGLGISFVR